jgi:hypothetical protein
MRFLAGAWKALLSQGQSIDCTSPLYDVAGPQELLCCRTETRAALHKVLVL